MPKDKSTGKKLADMMYGNPNGAAFGITPMIGKRREDRQDREAAKSFPVDLARGVVAGAVGMPGDIESLARLPYELITGNDSPTFLPTSEDVLKRIPFGTNTPAGQFASGLGTLAGGSANIGALPRAVKAAPGALKTAARNLSTPSTLNPQAGVIKMKGGNWLGGNLMGNIDRSVSGLKPYRDPEKALEGAEAALRRHEGDPRMLHAVEPQRRVVEDYRKKVALNNWVTNNLGKYTKNQMATPEDPIRLLLDKRTKEIEAKHAKDIERAERMAQRAIDEPDPRRQANMIRESERLKMEANVERQFAMDSIIPSRMQDYSPEADYYLKQRRQEAGFPAEGMGESEAARRYETLTDDAISTMRAGDVQETKNILAQAQDAERAFKTKQLEVAKRFDEHLRASGLNENEIRVLNEKTPITQKADIIQDREYGELGYAYNKLRTDIRRDEFAAGQENSFIEKLDPETQLYSGNTADMGFDHVIDILKQDVMEGRIRPEQLSKVSVEDAVRRTMEFDQEAAKKMAEAQIKNMEGFPVYKEYPEGYRWVELKKPEDLPEGYSLDDMGNVVDEKGHITNHPGEKRLEEALQYEGDTMGHCVGGYCPDVLEGKSRIFSLRDARGEPHVTIEVGPVQGRTSYEDMQAIYNQAQEEANAKNFATTGEFNNFYNDRVKELQFALIDKQKAELPERIVQIKGKQNAAPKAEYLPYVQDFVRGGTYSEVGDLENTGLFKLGSDYMTESEAAAKYKPMTQEALNFLETHPAFEQHRAAERALNEFTGDMYSSQLRGDVYTPEYKELESAAGTPVSENVPYTIRELQGLLTKPEEHTHRNGSIYEPISLAIEKLNQAKKELGIDLPPTEGMAHGGRVHFSDNPDVMALELAGGGAVRMQAGGLPKRLIDAGAKAFKALNPAKEEVKPSLVIKNKPGIIVSDLIDEDPEIAKRMGALARAKRQQAIEAEGKRQEAARQTQPSVGYRKSTPQKPDPLVGTRFINEAPFGLNPNEPFDLSKFKGGSGLVLPWDSQSRNVKTTQVSGMDLPNQIFRSTHGGVPYSFDTQHVAKGIAGSSGEEISKRVKTRADTAVRENIDRGGSGELLHMPITMGFRAEDYALPYSEFSFDIINYKLMTGELSQADADALTNMVRNYTPPEAKYKGKKPFADFAGFTSPEGLDQIYTGQGIKAPSGDLRKAIADRIIHQKGSQERLGFNAEDLMNATTYEPLRGVDKGFIGSSVMRNTPSGMRLSPSAGKYPYDTDFSGEHLGRFEDNVDVEALFYRTLNPIKRELMDRETKKPYTRESLRNAAIGAIEKRNENVSQMIDQQFLDDYDTYITEMRKPTEYRKGGSVKVEQKVQVPMSSQKKSEQRVQNPVHFTESPDVMRLALTQRN